MKSKLILFLVFANYLNLKGQDSGFLNGYIITNANDTIDGLVKYVNYAPYRVLIDIKFKEGGNSKTKTYPPNTILGYRAGEKIFHSVKIDENGDKQFMELVIDGYVRLYESTVSSFGVPQYGSASSVSSYLLKKDDKKAFSVGQGKFKERLSEYLADNTSLSEKIKNGDYKKKDLEEIVNEYNKSKRTN